MFRIIYTTHHQRIRPDCQWIGAALRFWDICETCARPDESGSAKNMNVNALKISFEIIFVMWLLQLEIYP